MTLQEIRERRAAKTAEARAIVNKADSEKRSLSADEIAKFDTIKADITNLEAGTCQHFPNTRREISM